MAQAFPDPIGKDSMFVKLLGVLPEERGKGAGTALMNHLCEIANQDGVVIALSASSEKNVSTLV